jgi:formate/nitrite transporter FocA (FNT family)
MVLCWLWVLLGSCCASLLIWCAGFTLCRKCKASCMAAIAHDKPDKSGP